MRPFLFIAAGFALCLVIGATVSVYLAISHPLGAITNHGYAQVQISGDSVPKEHYDLRKGESHLLPYGWYTITIPEAKTSFTLFKNNRGSCDIHTIDGLPVIEVNENASVMGGSK
jgi:hypothetical protein